MTVYMVVELCEHYGLEYKENLVVLGSKEDAEQHLRVMRETYTDSEFEIEEWHVFNLKNDNKGDKLK